jgi:hypothetical protein
MALEDRCAGRDGFAFNEWLATLTAARAVAEAVSGNTIDGLAVRADDLRCVGGHGAFLMISDG